MRLATYAANASNAEHLGLVIGGRIIDLGVAARTLGLPDLPKDMLGFIRAGSAALETAGKVAVKAESDHAGDLLENVRLLAPVPRPPRNVVCVGLNYSEHVAESQSVQGAPELPKFPVFFTKPPTCIIGPEEKIPWHGHVSQAIDWEAELAVVIGREVRDVSESDALGCVFGYTAANDVTARDLQGKHQQWYKGKGLDGFCPLGPSILTADEVPDPQDLDLALRVNGVQKQESNTRNMIFRVARLIAEWSAGMTLIPGDILLTGTPSGVGIGRKPPEFLKPGDVVEVEIEAIGVLRNAVAS